MFVTEMREYDWTVLLMRVAAVRFKLEKCVRPMMANRALVLVVKR